MLQASKKSSRESSNKILEGELKLIPVILTLDKLGHAAKIINTCFETLVEPDKFICFNVGPQNRISECMEVFVIKQQFATKVFK